MSRIRYLLLLSKQGKIRLIRWYHPYDQKEKSLIIREVTATTLSRKPKMCNILEYQDHKIVYKRYASLFFICGITPEEDNELLTLEIIHRFVETMDRYFGNVCELDIIFNFTVAYHILDEMIMCDGSFAESSKADILRNMATMDSIESHDNLDRVLS
ncbi:HFL153Cp [Eremothecium sinecaudum]|uniref:AP complex subunit sigma n=1 Tax=Eremothecium sinecaudum TaxID=45286 RepID=A0A109UZX0_9SACH|nr:HFL153Cp [Eremothecium sinecaudum]AMD21703.1 HFL153Cp [Eremothecium sinecaudum]